MKDPHSELLTAGFEIIGTNLAQQYLSLSANFRKPIPAHVKCMSEAMKSGRFKDNGYPIRFRVDGKLIDGQNRCLAIIDAGVTLRLLVVRNVSFDAEVTIDEGGKNGIQFRTLAEHLHSRGIGDSTNMAAIVRAVYRHVHGLQKDKSGKINASISQFLELFSQNRADPEAALSSANATSIAPRSQVGLIHFLAPSAFSGSDADANAGISWKDTVDAFVEKVQSGVGSSDDPAALLHMRVVENRSRKAKLPMSETGAITIKAWNAWSQGRPLKQLKWTRVGKGAESYPTPEFIPQIPLQR